MLHSVVVPVYNEEQGIAEFHRRLSAAMAGVAEGYEIVYVDDGSYDDSPRLLVELQRQDPHVRMASLSRNFGHQLAITAGIDLAMGDTVTVLDADLQDPPELIAELIAKWREGADVVFAVRAEREGESWFKKASAKAFYRLMNWLADIDIPSDAGDFRLMSRRAVNALRRMPESHRYIRGMVAWVGFKTATVSYRRDPRYAGETKYPLSKMLHLAADGVVAFSTRPLRIAVWLGLTAAVFSILAAIWALAERIAGRTVQGWTSLMVIFLMVSAAQLFTVGVLGEYLGRVYSEVQSRPLYLLGDVHGFGPDHPLLGSRPPGSEQQP